MTKCNNKTAFANIEGGKSYPRICGSAVFRQLNKGVLVTVCVHGLPYDVRYGTGIFGMHIHGGESCTGNSENDFADADGHFNPTDMPHPYHAGDLPPLMSNKDFAYISLITDRFTVDDIVGKVIIIHLNPDDFKTQPSGNSGKMIACGRIETVKG